jgi:uncharacterized membrane protein YesL
MSDNWTLRLHGACSVIVWCAVVNALVLVFTALGGVVLGLGPALIAAYVLTRRTLRGDAVRPLRDFTSVWRREFVRGNAVMLPPLLAAALLWANYSYFTALGPQASVARSATLIALIAVVGIGAILGPMYAHYALPLRAYLPMAAKFALAHPASTIILLFVFTTLAFVSAVFPVIAVMVSLGGWVHVSTWLCLRFFAENDDRLADQNRGGPPADVTILPAEPLRMR